MLLLTRLCGVYEEVYSMLPQERLLHGPPSDAASPHDSLKRRQEALYVVGKEKNELLLLAGDGKHVDGSVRTFIYAYHLERKQLKTLYHTPQTRCVGASIDHSRHILAMTTVDRRLNEAKQTINVFRTTLAEINPSGDPYRLNVRSEKIQRVQFVYSSDGPNKATYFLFFIEGLFVRLYQIYSQKRAKGGVKITSQPVLQAEVLKKHLWYQWDGVDNMLYCLAESKTGDTSLRCYTFPKKEKLMFEIPLAVSLSSRLQRFTRFRSQEALGCAKSLASRRVRIVRMRNGGLCLCHQHTSTSEQPTVIHVTLYILHHKVSIGITIPMNNFDAAVVEKTDVYFDTIGDMLMLYIPGHHFQLVDCGCEHAPCSSLCLTGPEYATPIPGSSRASLVSTGLSFCDDLDLRGHTFLEARTGVMYTYEFNRATIRNVFHVASPLLHTQVLHLAIVHMQDAEMYRQIIMSIFARHMNVFSPGVLKEYLVGTSYQRTKVENRVAPHVLSLLPVTCLEPFSIVPSSNSRHLAAISVLPLRGFAFSTTRNGDNVFSPRRRRSDEEAFVSSPRINLSTLLSPERRNSAVQASSPASGFRSIFRSILGSSEPELPSLTPDDESLELNSICTLTRAQFENALVDEMMRLHPRETRPRCMRWARAFRTVQIEQCNQLYGWMVTSARNTNQNPVVTFQLLEHMYCTLEELSFPLPKKFATHFALLGLRCLPRSVFWQYVERGVFYLTDLFIKKAVCELGSTPEENHFRFQLIMRMKNTDRIMSMLHTYPENHRILVSHYANLVSLRLPKAQHNEHDVDLLELANRSVFQPVVVYKENLMMHNANPSTQHRILSFIRSRASVIIDDVFLPGSSPHAGEPVERQGVAAGADAEEDDDVVVGDAGEGDDEGDADGRGAASPHRLLDSGDGAEDRVRRKLHL